MHQILLQITTTFTNDLVKLGPVVTLLLAAVYYLYKRQSSMETQSAERAAATEARAKELSDRLEQYMKDDRALLLTALNNNTSVMQRIEEHLNK